MIRIPVLVVCTNESELLYAWINKVVGLESNIAEPLLCIADNASSDGSSGVIWNAINKKAVCEENVIWLHKNYGFAAAQNQLIRMLGARNEYKYFATLNIDARPADKTWLDKLVAAAEINNAEKKVGMWNGLILDDKNHAMISSAGHELHDSGKFYDIDWKRDPNGRTEELSHLKPGFEPFSPCFAAGLWSFEMVKEAGLPDSDQFWYYDDVELAYKARFLGWCAEFVKDALAYHPLPGSKPASNEQQTQKIRGRLLVVARYFPDEKMAQVLSYLSEMEQKVFHTLSPNHRKRHLDDNKRKRIYDLALRLSKS